MNKKYILLICIFLTILFVMLGLSMVSATNNQTNHDSKDTNNYDEEITANDISDNIVEQYKIQYDYQEQDIGTENNTKTIDKDSADTVMIKEVSGMDETSDIVYVSSSGEGNGTRTNPTSFINALSMVNDNGTIVLTGTDDNIYYLNDIYINPDSFSCNVTDLHIVGEKNSNITINSYGGELFIIEWVNIHFKNINFVNGGNYNYYGSIIASQSSLIFENCNISDYHTRMKGCSYIKAYTSNISIINCIIHDNDIKNASSLIGNSIYRVLGYSMGDKFIQYNTYYNFTVINSTFKNNKLDHSSNLIFADSLNNLTVMKNTFMNNVGENGLIRSFMGKKEIYANNVFRNNNATCLYLSYSESDIKSNKFYNNHATKAPCLLLSETISNIHSNVFKDNSADTYGGSIINFANSQNNISNCVFEKNYAKTGGAIYNLYNNISINNCNFTYNHADEGGALYLGHQTFLDYTYNSNNTITNCLFNSNTAGKGSVLYLSDAQVNLSDNAIIDSTLNKNLVYLCDNSNYTIDNNWWSTNTPNFNVLTEGIVPNTWRIMTFENTTAKKNNTINLRITLNTLNNGKTIQTKLPIRTLYLNSTGGTFNKNNIKINSQTTVIYTGSDNHPTATIDNQQLSLNNKKEAFINVNNIKTRNNQSVNIQVNTNDDLTNNIKISVNNNVIKTCKTNGLININYFIDNSMSSGNYTIKVEYPGDTKYYPLNATAILEVYNTKNSKYNNIITPLSQKNNTIITKLPTKYDPRTLNLTTPLTDQGESGSCWVFASIGTLEASIKKSTNITRNFSENNAKNIISKYSNIGNINQLPNIGGRATEIIPYLVGWYGPVEESDDPYVDYSTFSPNINSSYHVQDVIFIKNRQNIRDYEKIKEAIYNYGAVQVAYVAGGTSTNIYNYENYDDNHAATFVGWDDNYDKNNFAITLENETIIPKGNGAFIIKNSWGGGFADDGYQYISYYDVTYGGYNDSYYLSIPMYSFMTNNTPDYSNIYQYDGISEGNYYINGEAGIKNIYTANHDETLAAIGTYIVDPSEYQLNIYINNKKVHTQKDTINIIGYRTIQLTKFFQLYKDDEFTIELKIKSLTDNYTTIYYQTSYEYPHFDKKNVSYISYDGLKTWIDMAENYQGAAVLKAYTLETPQLETIPSIKDNILTITTKVQNNYENATIRYKINNQTLKDANNKVITYKINKNTTIQTRINIENITGKDILETIYTSNEYIIKSENDIPKKTALTVNKISTTKIGEKIKIEGILKTEDNKTLSSENIIITLNNENITVTTDENGQYTYETTANTVGTNNITITYKGNIKYYESNIRTTFTAKNPTILTVGSTTTVPTGKQMSIYGKLTDNNAKDLAYQAITIKVDGKTYNTNTTQYGNYKIQITPTTPGTKTITATYTGTNTYASSTATSTFSAKNPTILTVGSTQTVPTGKQMSIYGKLTDNNAKDIANQTITIKVDGKTYTTTTTQYGNYNIKIIPTTPGLKTITANYAGNNIYLESSNSTTFTSKNPTILTVGSTQTVPTGKQMSVYGKLTDNNAKDIAYQTITIKVDGKTYNTNTTQYGNYKIQITPTTPGTKTITVNYNGNNNNLPSTNTTTFTAKNPTILTVGSTQTVPTGKQMSIYGKLTDNNAIDIANQTITIKVDGKTYTTITTQYGNYKIQITPTTPGTKTITANYAGTSIYLSSTVTCTFTANKIATVLTVGSTQTVPTGKQMSIYGKLTDNNAKDIAYQAITIKVDGKTYNTNTTQYGNYKIQITPTTPGTKTITATYAGTNTYASSTATSTFTAKNPTIITVGSTQTVPTGKQMSIYGKLTDNNAKDLAYQTITIKVDGKTYTTITTQYGNYKIQITPTTPGTKTITATYAGNNTYQESSNSTTFTAKNPTIITVGSTKTVTVGKQISVYGKLTDYNGKDLAYQPITIKVDGKMYNLNTTQYGNYNIKITPTTTGTKTVTVNYTGNIVNLESTNSTTFQVIKS